MASSSSVRDFPTISKVRTFVIEGKSHNRLTELPHTDRILGVGSGGDYHNVEGGHWLIDSKMSTILPCLASNFILTPNQAPHLSAAKKLTRNHAPAGASTSLAPSVSSSKAVMVRRASPRVLEDLQPAG